MNQTINISESSTNDQSAIGLFPEAALVDNALSGLARRFGLPLHVVFTSEVKEAAQRFREVSSELYPKTITLFAAKSNPCRGAIRVAKEIGLGVDVVSEFELRATLLERVPHSRLICNGNAKTNNYLRMAIAAEILISADSEEEIRLIAAEASRENRHARVLVRLSGMNLSGLTSADQSTAAGWTKFGVDPDQAVELFDLARRLGSVVPVGISAHIGTQICDEKGYERLITALLDVLETLKKAGHRIQFVDLGGGYPLSYLSRFQWQDVGHRVRSQ